MASYSVDDHPGPWLKQQHFRPWHIPWHICFAWLNFKQTRLIYSELATSLVQMTSFSVGELRIYSNSCTHTHDNSIDFWLLLKFLPTLCHDLHTWKIATHSSNSEATWNLTVLTNTQEDSFLNGFSYNGSYIFTYVRVSLFFESNHNWQWSYLFQELFPWLGIWRCRKNYCNIS